MSIDVRSPASAAPRSRRGTTMDGASARADDQQRQALEGHRLVAGQVAQVRADPDEQRGHAGLGGDLGGPRQALA